MSDGLEGLEVFQRAYKVSLAIHRVSLKFPRPEQYGLAEQMRRASKSIPANLAEGYTISILDTSIKSVGRHGKRSTLRLRKCSMDFTSQYCNLMSEVCHLDGRGAFCKPAKVC